MKENKDKSASDRRRRAEEQLRGKQKGQSPEIRNQRTAENAARLVHELQVHQIELEMQVEELRESHARAEELLAQYTDLYDLAPAGYLTLDRIGAIRQVNLAGARLLGIEGSRLANRRFAVFVAEGDRRAFNAFLESVFASEVKHSCEVTLPREGSHRLVVRIEGERSANGRKCRALLLDITERSVREQQKALAMQVLAVLNRRDDISLLVKDVLALVMQSMGFEAVGIRLQEGDDFPYYETQGFPDDFLRSEQYLCGRDEAGEPVQDAEGNPILECMCGNIIRGRTDPSKPFFTEAGSFWTNCTSELPASTTEKDRQCRMCNRCNGEGYESVALIPLRSGDEMIGLLQLNDHRKGMFTLETVEFLEQLGVSIGIALTRSQAADALRNSEEKLRSLVEHAPDIIMTVDSEGTILFINRTIPGYATEEVIGTKVYDHTLPEFHASMRRCIEEVHETGEISSYETAQTNADGSRFYYSTHVSPLLRDGKAVATTHICRDITERKRAEDAMRDSETRYRVLFETSADGILIADCETRAFKYANPAICRLLGYTEKELKTVGVSDIHPKDALPHVAAEFENQARGERTLATALPCLRKDQTIFYADVNATTATIDGKTHMVGFFRDITERLSMEGHLRQSQKLESIGTLAGGVAHEINNPVMGIMNYAQLILDKLGPDSPVAEYATEIGKETKRVATIVKSLLSFARHDKQTYNPARMCDIVESSLSLIRALLRLDQIALEVDVPEDLPEIKCRSQQIQQVIMNLLTNAHDAQNEKCKGFDDNKRVAITAHTLDKDGHQWIRTTVEDCGAGMTEEVRQRMFEPFYTTKPRDKGTGLGLSISHGIVTNHGGELVVESKVGEYTRFHLDLPTDGEWNPEGQTKES